jgi:NAD(P)-dependent dehydrogenase (short-subunit alcohol dehydrogenase family)
VEADVHAMVQSALDNFGRLDVLVNNAAHQQASAAADRLDEESGTARWMSA